MAGVTPSALRNSIFGLAIWMPVSLLNVMMEVSMATEITPMRSRVVAAFLLFGFSNAGTPLEMASTPVSAAQPEAKARSMRKATAAPAREE